MQICQPFGKQKEPARAKQALAMKLGIVLLVILSGNLVFINAMLLKSSTRSFGSRAGSLTSSFAAKRPLLNSMQGARLGGLRLYRKKPEFTQEAEAKYFGPTLVSFTFRFGYSLVTL